MDGSQEEDREHGWKQRRIGESSRSITEPGAIRGDYHPPSAVVRERGQDQPRRGTMAVERWENQSNSGEWAERSG
jgi:hypothetical protein